MPFFEAVKPTYVRLTRKELLYVSAAGHRTPTSQTTVRSGFVTQFCDPGTVEKAANPRQDPVDLRFWSVLTLVLHYGIDKVEMHLVGK